MNRAERRNRTSKVIARRLKDAPSWHHIHKTPHKAHKKHPLDCGNAGCQVCHNGPARPVIDDLRERLEAA